MARACGRGYAEERARAERQLHAYLEELTALRRAAGEGAAEPWLSLTPSMRRRLLAEAGVRPIWTRVTR